MIAPEEDIDQRVRLWKIDERRSYLIEEMNQNELISKKYKKLCRVLNYMDHLLVVTSISTGCVSIFALLL